MFLLSVHTFKFWKRKWHPILISLPGKSHGQRSLVGYSPWGHKESDTTERLHSPLKFRLRTLLPFLIHHWIVTTLFVLKKLGIYFLMLSLKLTYTLSFHLISLSPAYNNFRIGIFTSVHSVMSDSLQPHELHHARPPCPTPTPRVHPNSCQLSR